MLKERIHQGDVLPLRYQSHPIHISPLGGTHWVFVPLQIVLYLVALSISVFVQIKPGKDYFGFRHLIATTLFMTGYYWGVTLFIGDRTTTFLIFISIFFGVGLSWRCLSLYKTIMGIPMHTRDRGQYWFIWNALPFKNPYWTYAWVLPIFILTVAAWTPDWTLRTWLIIASVGQWVRANTDAFFLQQRKDSITNSMTEWETVSSSSSGQAGATASSSVNHTTASPHVEQPTIDTALHNLDPSLQSLLDKD